MFSPEAIASLRESLATDRPGTGPSDVQILPTPRCNAACAFCPLCAIPEPLLKHTPRFHVYTSDLPGGLLDRLADDLYALGGLKRLTITGGEPLLYPFLAPAMFVFRQSFPAAELNLVTNGLRLRQFASLLALVGLSRLTVSVNAGREESYRRQNPGAAPNALAEIAAGIEEVVKARKSRGADRPQVTLSAVLTRASAADVEPLFELGRRAGADAVTFVPLMEIWLEGQAVNRELRVSDDEFKRFLDDVDRVSERAPSAGLYLGYAGTRSDRGVMDNQGWYSGQPCYAGHTFAAIYPNGDVRPCCHCEPVMGNLTESSFAEIWTSTRYREMRERMSQIQTHGALEGCFCGECGYVFENREFHRRLTGE